MDPSPCQHCKNEIPLDWTHCPHCGDGLKCPNVRLAEQASERDALEFRYQAALKDATERGCDVIVSDFDKAVRTSQAVLGSKLGKIMPIVNRDRDVFATIHDLADMRFLRAPEPDRPDWNVMRPAAEVALLGSNRHIDKLHYAALSLDGRSLPHYGEVTIVLREEMIAGRASLFEENSAVFVHRHGAVLPKGSRATWAERHKLCVAKLARRFSNKTRPERFSEILLEKGRTEVDDQFVEVVIFGPMTFATFQKLTLHKTGALPSSLKRPRTRRGTTDELAVRDYCKIYKTVFELV